MTDNKVGYKERLFLVPVKCRECSLEFVTGFKPGEESVQVTCPTCSTTDTLVLAKEEETVNSPAQFERLGPDEKVKLCDWIFKNLAKIHGINKRHSSYGLKHVFEGDKDGGGFYVTNGAFKGAMRYCGFTEFNTDQINWYYNVSERSLTELRNREYAARCKGFDIKPWDNMREEPIAFRPGRRHRKRVVGGQHV